MSKAGNPLTYTPVQLPAPMRAQPIMDAVHTWLKYVDFATLTELYWRAQNERADEEDRDAKRAADPDDLFGKSLEYVAAYYERKREPTP